MVNHFTICCLHCAKLFDEDNRKPCLGTCSHSICDQCLSTQKTKKCPVCDKEDAFAQTVINYHMIQMLIDLRNELTQENFLQIAERFENIDQGKCSECTNHSEKLRICVFCVKPHNILSAESENTWILAEDDERSFLKAKSLAICSECTLEKHESHKVIRLSLLTSGMPSKQLFISGALLEQKLNKENRFGGWQSVVTHFQSLRARFQVKKELRKRTCVDDLPSVEFSSKPEWESIMKKSREEVKRNCELDELYENRKLKSKREILQKYVHEAFIDSELAHEELKNILEKFPEDRISEEQTGQVDAKIVETMTLLESKLISESRLPVDEESEKYFKYKVIVSELRESLKEMETSKEQLAQKITGFQKACSEMRRFRNEVNSFEKSGDFSNMMEYFVKFSEFETKLYVYKRELVEKQLEVDEYIIKYMKASGRKEMADLMTMKYFTDDFLMSSEDRVYLRLIQEAFVENAVTLVEQANQLF